MKRDFSQDIIRNRSSMNLSTYMNLDEKHSALNDQNLDEINLNQSHIDETININENQNCKDEMNDK